MKKFLLISSVLFAVFAFQSCSPQYVTKSYSVSASSYFVKEYMGKDKMYIINNFDYSLKEIKRLDEQHEILIFERYRPIGGAGYTHFYIRNGKCYNIKTNEVMKETKTIQVSFLDWFMGNY